MRQKNKCGWLDCIFQSAADLSAVPAHSWRKGDAQCCELSNIADTFSEFFPLKKAPKPYLVSENRRYYCWVNARSCFPSMRAHTSLFLSLHLLSFCSACAHISLSLSASAQFLFSVRTYLSLSLCICSVSDQRARTPLSLSASAQMQHLATAL